MNQTNEPVAWNFEYDQLTEEFIHALDDKTSISIMGFNRGYWAQYFNSKKKLNSVTIPSAEYAKLKEDAERYRFIRENKLNTSNFEIMMNQGAEGLDFRIDEAIAKVKDVK